MDLTAIIIVLIVIGLPIMAFTLIKLAKIITGEARSWRERDGDAEETKIIQQLHLTLTKLEQRMDSLETIVLEKHKK